MKTVTQEEHPLLTALRSPAFLQLLDECIAKLDEVLKNLPPEVPMCVYVPQEDMTYVPQALLEGSP